MIKKTPILIFFLLFVVAVPIHAQYINLQLRIEPLLSTTVEQDLTFGTQVTNSGRTEIQLGDMSMGIFSVKAFYTQNVYLNLEYPDALENENPGIRAQIPLQLNMAYNNSGTNNVDNSTFLEDNGGFISVHENTNLRSSDEIWQVLYLYVYGSIEVGNIPNGVYSGDIVLTVDYD